MKKCITISVAELGPPGKPKILERLRAQNDKFKPTEPEPKPTQYGHSRSRLRNLGFPELAKKVAAPHH